MEKREVLIDLLNRFELYYHKEYGENIVSGAIDSFIKSINTEEKTQEKDNNICKHDYREENYGCAGKFLICNKCNYIQRKPNIMPTYLIVCDGILNY